MNNKSKDQQDIAKMLPDSATITLAKDDIAYLLEILAQASGIFEGIHNLMLKKPHIKGTLDLAKLCDDLDRLSIKYIHLIKE